LLHAIVSEVLGQQDARAVVAVIGHVGRNSIPVIDALLIKALIDQWSLSAILGFMVVEISAHFLYQLWQSRSDKDSRSPVRSPLLFWPLQLRTGFTIRLIGQI